MVEDKLTGLKCVPCRGGEPTLTDAEIEGFRPQVPGWTVLEVDGVRRIEKEFKFKDFREALRFADEIGRIAEEEGHHPVIILQWGKARVTWWTHKIKGLHRNDFIMAAKTDALEAELRKAPGA